jgi:DNA-binding transcriptional LysR family regulator
MDWDKLRIFNAAAEAGSFTNAGEALSLSQSAVSRQITALEQCLKSALFHRHARGLKLTEQGELLHGAVREVIARVSMAEALLTERRDYAGGPLKVSTTPGFGAFWLAPRLKEFHDLYPEITITLLLDGGRADLSMGEADVAIRMSAPQKADLIQRRILTWRSYAYASPEYLKKHGIPSRGEDLDHHWLVVHGSEGARDVAADDWLLELGMDGRTVRQPVAALNDLYGLYRALLGGLGIGALPHFILPESAGLIRVLPDAASPKMDGYFVYPAELRQSKRIAVFRDFIIAQIAEARLNSDPFDMAARSVGAELVRHTPIRSLSDEVHAQERGGLSPGQRGQIHGRSPGDVDTLVSAK